MKRQQPIRKEIHQRSFVCMKKSVVEFGLFNGYFRLVDAWLERIEDRKVFKFKLILMDNQKDKTQDNNIEDIDNPRIIPSWVKREVWKRDKGRCVICGCENNLHFDHVIPYSKGGSSQTPDNIQLLCARHNYIKRDKIQ